MVVKETIVIRKPKLVKKREVVVEKSTTARQRKGKSRKPQIPASMAVAPSTRMLARSIIDPFIGSVCVPDGSDGGCFSLQQQAVLTSDANGACSFILNGDPANLYYASTGLGGGNGWNIAGPSVFSSSTNLASVSLLYSKIRIISMGCKVTCIQPTMTDGGTTICAQIPGSYTANTLGNQGANSIATVEANSMLSEIGMLKTGCYFTWRPEDMLNISQYSAYNGAATGVNTQSSVPQYPYLFVGILGATVSTTVARVEFVVNFQGQYRSNTLKVGDASRNAPPAEPGWMEKAVNVIKKIPQFLPLVADVVGTIIPGGGLIGKALRLFTG